MQTVFIVMFDDRRTGDCDVDKAFVSRDAALRYAVPKMMALLEGLGEPVAELGETVEALERQYPLLKNQLGQADAESAYGIEKIWIVEKVLE